MLKRYILYKLRCCLFNSKRKLFEVALKQIKKKSSCAWCWGLWVKVEKSKMDWRHRTKLGQCFVAKTLENNWSYSLQMLNPSSASFQQVADAPHKSPPHPPSPTTQTARLNHITETLCHNTGVLICDDEPEKGQGYRGMPAGADQRGL